jgi:hypothetical protein
MENLKIYVTDPFNYTQSLRGFNLRLAIMQSDIYNYGCTWAFRKEYKAFADEFEDRWQELDTDPNFFLLTENPWVIHTVNVRHTMLKLGYGLVQRFGLDWGIDQYDSEITAQSNRYAPFELVYVYSKSTKKLKLYYERTVIGHINYLYTIACMFSAGKYRIPRVLKHNFKIDDPASLRLLNHDDDLISLISEVIVELMGHLQDLNKLKTLTAAEIRKNKKSNLLIKDYLSNQLR